MRAVPAAYAVVFLSGCSLIVPSEDDFTYHVSDGGDRPDANADPDAGQPQGMDGCVGTQETCNGADDDCDGVVDEDGAADACSPGSGVSATSCREGECAIEACADGLGDCDGTFENGCETDLTTLDDCGACGVSCAWECGATGCNDAVDVDIAVGHACAARADGTVVCWGNNARGQLGDTSTDDSLRPVTVLVSSNALRVGLGANHSCLVSASGGALCWGGNESGQLGGATSRDPIPEGVAVASLGDAIELEGGAQFSCARRGVGESICWGRGVNALTTV